MNQSIRIGLSGASGKMGQSIFNLTQKENLFQVSHKYDREHSLNTWRASEIDVVIDFSQPISFDYILSWCVKNKKPLVSGTTGFSKKEKSQLIDSSKSIPILYSANMSLGIAIFNQWLEKIPATIRGWDMQIQETHHKEKKDAPSGTALLLQHTVQKQGISLPEPLSIRGGGVHGIHKISFMGEGEVLSIKHFAQDRKIFARGALLVAKWLIKKPSGLYSMKDFLL